VANLTRLRRVSFTAAMNVPSSHLFQGSSVVYNLSFSPDGNLGY